MKKIMFLLICLLFLGGCGEAKLIDGKEAIVTFNNSKKEGITAEDLYNVLKEKYGINFLIDMIDTKLLSEKYKETDEEISYINQVINSINEYATKNNTTFLDYIKSNYGLASEEEFKEYISLNYKRGLCAEDFAKTLVNDKQIEDYYKDYTIGDIKASHILIDVNVKKDATDEEKKKAEEDAKNKAIEIIKKLDKGEDFAKLAKENSKDSSNAKNGGDLGYFNRGVMDKSFEDAAVALEKGQYTKTPVKSAFGYHIILKTDQKKKPSLKEAKEAIIETIAKETLETNSNNIYIQALEDIRTKNKMNIKDSDLKNGYENYLSKLKLNQ